MKRNCVKCGSCIEPVKNGFYFSMSGYFATSDLWGCKRCQRFQIHGCPGLTVPIAQVYGGVLVEDPGNKSFKAILEPDFDFPPGFHEHMKEWYPDWNWEGGEE